MHSGCKENDWGLSELVEFGERVDWEDDGHIDFNIGKWGHRVLRW